MASDPGCFAAIGYFERFQMGFAAIVHYLRASPCCLKGLASPSYPWIVGAEDLVMGM
jgi:hypothetical protein